MVLSAKTSCASERGNTLIVAVRGSASGRSYVFAVTVTLVGAATGEKTRSNVASLLIGGTRADVPVATLTVPGVALTSTSTPGDGATPAILARLGLSTCPPITLVPPI